MSNTVVRTTSPAPSPAEHLLVSIFPAERAAFFPTSAPQALRAVATHIDVIDPEDVHSHSDLAQTEIAVVAWGFPRLEEQMLARMPKLRLVANAASSVRALVSDAFWETGIPITQAGAAMSPAVAEMSLTLTLSLLRRTHRIDHALRTGRTWDEARTIDRAREISGAVVGVIGASRTGREYIRMCRALGAEIRVYDPYLPTDDDLATFAVSLDDLLTGSDVVAIHAPATTETAGMLGRDELASMRDGTALVNTARSSLIDMDALHDEVAAGRIDAALDVFDLEPLPTDDRWRSLDNVLLTGHVAGATVESRARAGAIVVDEIGRFLGGQDLRHRVTRESLGRMG